MDVSFDLISDLHVDSWPTFDWTHQATSPFCVVAGDVAQDHQLLVKTLKHLSRNYQAVFYIDGNEEHRYGLEDLDTSYQILDKELSGIKNFVFLHDQIVILEGVAFVAVNSWTTFNWDPNFTVEHGFAGIQDHYGVSHRGPTNMQTMAISDAVYLQNNIKKLQTHKEVKTIVIVTHTVPNGEFLQHDTHLNNSYRLNASVNSYVNQCSIEDTENKVKFWCFGHYHYPIDQTVNGIRYVCNPRGRSDTPWHRDPYYPVRINT